MHHGRRIVAGIGPVIQRIAHHALPKVAIVVGSPDAIRDRLVQIARDVYVLPHVQKHHRHAGVLTDGHALGPRNFVILQKLFHYVAAFGGRFLLKAHSHSRFDIGANHIIGLDQKLADGV